MRARAFFLCAAFLAGTACAVGTDISTGNHQVDPAANHVTVLFLPQQNDEYAPRDIQLRLAIEDEYSDPDPLGTRHQIALTGFAFRADWRDMRPTPASHWSNATTISVTLSINTNTSVSSQLNPRAPNYLPGHEFRDKSITGSEYGLSQRVSSPLPFPHGPLNERFTLEDGRFDLVIECHTPGDTEAVGTTAGCTMRYGTLPPMASRFMLETSVNFPRDQLANWRQIKANVEAFVARRSQFVPFQAR